MPEKRGSLGVIRGGAGAVKTTVQLYAHLAREHKPWDFGRHELDRMPKPGHEIVLTGGGRTLRLRVVSVYRRIVDEHGNTGIPNVYTDEI